MRLCKTEEAVEDSDGWDRAEAALKRKVQRRLADT